MTHRFSFAATAAAFFAFGACTRAPSEPATTETFDEASAPDVTYSFEGVVDTRAKTVRIRSTYNTAGRALEQANVVQTGAPGGNPPDTFELITLSTATDADGTGACGFPSSFCANVQAVSHYGIDLTNVMVHITALIPLAGHAPLNSDPSQGALQNNFGLFLYGNIPSGGSATRLWAFGDNGTTFRIRGRVFADFVRTPRGSPIAVNPFGNTIAVANVRTHDITLMNRSNLAVRARVPSGGQEPVSVAWNRDSSTLYVVNRLSQNVVRFRNANTPSPVINGTVATGSEPGLAALTPNGTLLFVPNMNEGTVTVIRTSDMTVQATIPLTGANPYAACMTNDGDQDDNDELVFITDFYARGDATQLEATDAARRGRVFRIDVAGLTPTAINLSAVPNVFPFLGFNATGAYPNQLYNCSVNRDRVYISNVGASPASFANATDFHQNVQGLISVIDLDGNEDLVRRVNLNSLVETRAAPRRFMSVPVGIEFVPGTEMAVVISRNSDAAFKVQFDDVAAPAIGFPSTINFLDTRGTAQAGRPNIMSPMGIAIFGQTAYVYNEASHSVVEFDLAANTRLRHVSSSPLPALGSPEEVARRGLQFFDTGLGRWSANGWVGCVACHPFGATDNVTWSFPAGPRQTIDLTASFDVSGLNQRVFNWSGIFDEVADFELNTRGVSGGVGAIVHTLSNPPVNSDRIDIAAIGQSGNIGSAEETSFGVEDPEDATIGELEDWLDITEWMRTLRSPRGRVSPAGDAVAGRVVFQNLGCQNCHGGALWTLSSRYNTPARNENCTNVSLLAVGVTSVGNVPASQVRTTDTSQLLVIGPDAGAPTGHECVKRIVATFNNAGPQARGAAEIRQNGTTAQGANGFNVPSLLGMASGAPYLHHGAAETLQELLDPAGAFVTHLTAGNAGASPTATEIADLIAFVESIDETTPVIDVPAGFTFCPGELNAGCTP